MCQAPIRVKNKSYLIQRCNLIKCVGYKFWSNFNVLFCSKIRTEKTLISPTLNSSLSQAPKNPVKWGGSWPCKVKLFVLSEIGRQLPKVNLRSLFPLNFWPALQRWWRCDRWSTMISLSLLTVLFANYDDTIVKPWYHLAHQCDTTVWVTLRLWHHDNGTFTSITFVRYILPWLTMVINVFTSLTMVWWSSHHGKTLPIVLNQL